MIPKEKANNIIDIFSSKEMAIHVVEEIIDALETYDDRTEDYLKDEFGKEYFSCELQNMDSDFRYWSKVKSEINSKTI